MANLLFDYAVLDQGYTHGKLQFITGTDGTPAANVGNPADTKIDDIAPYADMDPEVFSYTSQGTARALLCNVTTDSETNTSTGKYTVCTPTAPVAPATAWTWAITGPKDIQLVDSDNNPVAGNPYGVAQADGFLFIPEYDTAKISILYIEDFEAQTGTTYQVRQEDATGLLNLESGYFAHGAAILSLTNGSDTYVYVLFAIAQNSGGYPFDYTSSVIVRYQVLPTTDPAIVTLDNPLVVNVGPNANALVPVPGTADGTGILAPAMGGAQQYGTTNGTNSSLSVVPAFDNFDIVETASIAFTGDTAGDVTPTGAYDIKSVAVSVDGNYAYLLTATYTEKFLVDWRLYQTTVAKIIAAIPPETDPPTLPPTLSAAVTAGVLIDVDSTVDPDDGDPGNYWEVQYENAASPTIGRLWFVKGSPIRISLGNSYSTFKLIDAGSSSPLYSPAFNVNSADLIAETIYAAGQGVSKDTRLIKGNVARQATQAAAAASEEEEEK